MNILGHLYVASKTLNSLNPLIIAGSEIPDFVPFIPNSTFSFEEIHESGDKFLSFLKRNHPKEIALALSMMTHSVKFGVDSFNRDIDTWLIGNKEELKREYASKIVDCSGISFDTAIKSRMHNYLWTGIDIYLLKKDKRFIEEIKKFYKDINYSQISKLLATGFRKEESTVYKEVEYFFSSIDLSNLNTIKDYVKIWKAFSSGLPERDNVNISKTENFLEEIYEEFEDKWENILNDVLNYTKKKMSDYISLKKGIYG